MRRFEIWLANLPSHQDGCSLIRGKRPVVIISNDKANQFSQIITVVPLTTNVNKRPQPTHALLHNCGVARDSLALCEQVMAVDKSWLLRPLGQIDQPASRNEICRALSIHLGMAM